MNKNEFYFNTDATENEHYILEGAISKACKSNNLELAYYRKFKSGHVPMQRECKIGGDEKDIANFKKWARTHPIEISNFWRREKDDIELLKSIKLYRKEFFKT